MSVAQAVEELGRGCSRYRFVHVDFHHPSVVCVDQVVQFFVSKACWYDTQTVKQEKNNQQ